jgi:hypothetical protein
MDASSRAYDIAWHFVSTAYGLCEDDLVAQAYLAAHILRQHRRGERRAIALANRAIGAYAKCAKPEAGVARAVAIS